MDFSGIGAAAVNRSDGKCRYTDTKNATGQTMIRAGAIPSRGDQL